MNPRNKLMDCSLLEEGLSKLGLPGDRILSLLIRYMEEIELFNPAYGLVKVRDRGELIKKHILDSLAPIGIIRGLTNKTIADVGSGAGLPGIPLAICLPGTEFTLIERMGRRAGFLRNTLAVLGLSNVKVEEADMEKLPISESGLFDLTVFRAFKPLDNGILKGLKRLLKPGGIIAAYKGRRQSIEEEMSQTALQRETILWEIIPLAVPFLEEERHLVLLRSN
jgi:16S rRNA (guanine527-N7)-methyltransferase